jgi:hypothetical protein
MAMMDRARAAMPSFEVLREGCHNSCHQRPHHGFAVEAETPEFAPCDRVTGAFHGEQMNRIFFALMCARSHLESKFCHEIQLTAALAKIKASDLRVLLNQSEQRGSKATPACMEIHCQLHKLPGNRLRAGPCGEFFVHGCPFGSYPSLVSRKEDFAFVSEVLVKRPRGVAGFRCDAVGVGAVVSRTVEHLRRRCYQTFTSARG